MQQHFQVNMCVSKFLNCQKTDIILPAATLSAVYEGREKQFLQWDRSKRGVRDEDDLKINQKSWKLEAIAMLMKMKTVL